MRRLQIFIGLKFKEIWSIKAYILAIIFPTVMGFLYKIELFREEDLNNFGAYIWSCGFCILVIVLGFCLSALAYVIAKRAYDWIKDNWRRAGEIETEEKRLNRND